MPNPQLVEYIRAARMAGTPDAQITQILEGSSWPPGEIAEAFAALAEGGDSPVSPRGTRASRFVVFAIIAALVLGGGYLASAKFLFHLWPFTGGPAVSVSQTPQPANSPQESPGATVKPFAGQRVEMKKFASEQEFKEYLQAATENAFGLGGGQFFGAGSMVMEGVASAPMARGVTGSSDFGSAAPQRVSQTNVQVAGIDEPDIVKTDGKEIYFSSRSSSIYGRGIEPMPLQQLVPPMQTQGESSIIAPGIPYPYPTPTPPDTKLIRAFPPANLARDGGIDKMGQLLISDTTLLILPEVQQYFYGYYGSESGIYGYDVSDPKQPKQLWKMDLRAADEDNKNEKRLYYDGGRGSRLVASRLYQKKLYLVLATATDISRSCPIVPLMAAGAKLSIPCVDIYYPSVQTSVDATYTALVIDPKTGKIENRISFVGASSNTLVTMSENALYISYARQEGTVAILEGFLEEKGKDLFPTELLERVRKLKGYELSEQTKLTEVMFLFQKFIASLSNDERLRVENELTNRAKDYFAQHARDLTSTVIVKIDARTLAVAQTGTIPGTLLNQFSLDEYKGYVRAATTFSGSGGVLLGLGGGSSESGNDVYILDEKLNITGSVKDLGLGERIYSARFVEDKGYLVTFRQVDPFYVLDLHDPKNPVRAGELKIPGFSSYLHPITKDLVLGVGQEGSQVKLSLFDVSNPANPVEKDKYLLSEYWTDVSNNYHAFLLDGKHEIFFLPASRGGYVFSYSGNTLKLKIAISDIQARRALYINDYLYVVGDSKIVVYNEQDWQKVNQLEL